MEGLMYICSHHGYPLCHSHIKERYFPSEYGVPEAPVGDELIKMNEICKQCEHAHFEIRNRGCPACGSNRISSRAISAVSVGPVKASHTTYFYKCEVCGKHLYSYMQL